MKRLDAYWDSRNALSRLLLPLSWLFCGLAWLRRRLYGWGLLSSQRLPLPVIVVGNISVGGTGKTPLVIWLIEHLQGQGLRPGIVARGYGGKAERWPQQVNADSRPSVVGDEPAMIVRRTGAPMWVGPDRVAAAHALLEQADCDVIISDDGLQHYALQRDIEIVVVDGQRRFGNGWCLPAGPLRERPSRLKSVDLVVVNGEAGPGEFAMRILPGRVVNLRDPQRMLHLEELTGQTVLAVAGIGNPQRFFDMLHANGLEVEARAFPDHHRFQAADIPVQTERAVLMTEKDAVKCMAFAQAGHWYVEAEAELEGAFPQRLDELLRGLRHG